MINHPTPVSTDSVSTEWTTEAILDLIRKLRNDLVKDFLDERHLHSYIRNTFGLREVMPARTEMIRSALKEMLISPVDVKLYQPLIDHIRQTDSAALSDGNEELFYREIDRVIRIHLY